MPEGQQPLVRRVELLLFQQFDLVNLAPIQEDLLIGIWLGHYLALSLADYLGQLLEIVVAERPVLDLTVRANRREVAEVLTAPV